MRKLSANYIVPVASPPLKNGIIVIDDNGKIVDIRENPKQKEFSGVEFYNGVLVPGFVNTHCHLELSYLKGKFERGGGLKKFLLQIVNYYRNNTLSDEEKRKKSQFADVEMYNNGIVAVGDVSNHAFSAEVKNKSEIYYHTFLEILDDFNDETRQKKLQKALEVVNVFNRATIVPHAHYDVSCSLMKKLVKMSEQNSGLFSIHNQETADENLLFERKKGKIVELFDELGLNIDNFVPTGKNSLQSNFECIKGSHKLLLVHNIYTSEEDLSFLNRQNTDVYFAFCPSSNLFIEERLPDFEKFADFFDKCTIGTDSYASNTQLDILEEMKLIDIPFSEKIKWATINGAKFLGIDDVFGSFEVGKTPGINLIENFDFDNFELTDESRVKKLI